ncbi:MAG: hypothetical protein NZM35_10495 [Chitinophagales bacterium]|nr:hypothetical protein [Chitinophagales bacterium]MDW8419759.1 hypothetical protein [Chitinophagales bacterium]
MFKTIREFENLHIVLWLLKDFCWVSEFKIAGMIMVLPTVGVGIYITWLSRFTRSDFYHNLAVCCWIIANCVWMTGEFFFNDGTRPLAKVFFISGLVLVSLYYLVFLRRDKSVGS